MESGRGNGGRGSRGMRSSGGLFPAHSYNELSNVEMTMATGNGEESRQEIGLMSRKCRDFSADLSAYFDGELEGKLLQLLESHLQDCDGCRGDLEKMGRIRSALFSLTGSPAEREPLVQQIMEKIRQDSDEDDRTPS